MEKVLRVIVVKYNKMKTCSYYYLVFMKILDPKKCDIKNLFQIRDI